MTRWRRSRPAEPEKRRKGVLNPSPEDMTVVVVNGTPWHTGDLQALCTEIRRLAFVADAKTLPLAHNQTKPCAGAVRFVERALPAQNETRVDTEEGNFFNRTCVEVSIPTPALMGVAPLQIVADTATLPESTVQQIIRGYARVIRNGCFDTLLSTINVTVRLARYDVRLVQQRLATEWRVEKDLTQRLTDAADFVQHATESVEAGLQLLATINTDASLSACDKQRTRFLHKAAMLQDLTTQIRAATER